MNDKVQQLDEQVPPLPSAAVPLEPPSVNAIWKGENESDGEYTDDQELPLE